jgi:hypothetical protein
MIGFIEIRMAMYDYDQSRYDPSFSPTWELRLGAPCVQTLEWC